MPRPTALGAAPWKATGRAGGKTGPGACSGSSRSVAGYLAFSPGKLALRAQSLFKKGARTSGAWKVFERSLYYISTEKKTWHDAESFCMSRDAHLASVNTDKEQNYISSQLDEPAWIGLTDENEEGNWKWSDGSRVFPE
ncbi:C-type lectin domain family 4 member F [Varanus komodoensis]|nr:C-type lectin domain family 4 member F [Varanus komodoensis]